MGGGVACCRRGLLFWLAVAVDVDVGVDDVDDDVKSWWAKVFLKKLERKVSGQTAFESSC